MKADKELFEQLRTCTVNTYIFASRKDIKWNGLRSKIKWSQQCLRQKEQVCVDGLVFQLNVQFMLRANLTYERW